MSASRAVTLLVAAVLTAAVLAGCGGEASGDPTAAAGTGPAGTAGATAPAAALDPAVDLLDPEAVPGLDAGSARRLGGAQEVIDVLYQPGDPTAAVARRRLEAAGFAGGVLRDQAGSDPGSGLALLRTYALRLGDPEAARAEVTASVAEVQASTRFPSEDVILDIPDSRAIRIDLRQPGMRVTVLFATFAAGPTLYGVQAFTRGAAELPEREVLQAVTRLRARVAGGD